MAHEEPCAWQPDSGAMCDDVVGCRYGYSSVQQCQGVVDGYAAAGVPLETIMSDSQYMDRDQDFTLGAAFPLSDMQARHAVARAHCLGRRVPAV